MVKVQLQLEGHRSDGYTEDTVQETYPALMTENGDKSVLHYVMNSSEDEVRCRMTISPARLTIENHGAVESYLKLEPGVTAISSYKTPYGNFPIETATDKLEVIKTGHTIAAKVHYSLFSEGHLINQSQLRIIVTPEE
ncbi:MAG: DUF1934 domain-containing protein [Lachnospiraceae bacterium]|nr:DUF1934 domain-containing protein [Lachnospiraceae bacterium]